MEQGAREIIIGKIKKEQGAKNDEKGAVKIGIKERAPKNEREQGEWGKMSKGAGSIDPPNRASKILPILLLHIHPVKQTSHI